MCNFYLHANTGNEFTWLLLSDVFSNAKVLGQNLSRSSSQKEGFLFVKTGVLLFCTLKQCTWFKLAILLFFIVLQFCFVSLHVSKPSV